MLFDAFLPRCRIISSGIGTPSQYYSFGVRFNREYVTCVDEDCESTSSLASRLIFVLNLCR